MSPYRSRNSIRMTLFTDYCAHKLIFTGDSVCFYSIDGLSDSGSLWKNPRKHFFISKQAYPHTSHIIL